MKSLFGLLVVVACCAFGCAPSDTGDAGPSTTTQIQAPATDVSLLAKV